MLFHLNPHQNTAQFLRAGQQLFVECGQVLLREAPSQQGHSVAVLTRCLGTGEAHRVVQGGWVQINARVTSRLRLG